MRNFLVVLVIFTAFATAAMADSLPAGWKGHRFNGPNQPTVEDGVVTFQIFDRRCSDVDYGDGRGETDCLNGNVRSTIIHSPNARIGQSIEYRFDVWIDPSFALGPFRNPDAMALIPQGLDSRLRLASWEGTYLHNFLYNLKVDNRNGISILGQQCQAPQDFGKWVTFSLKVRWANNDRGWIKIACDDRVIYADENVATNQAPHCYISNQCEAGKFKDPSQFIFLLGPVVGGYGREYAKFGFTSPFIPIQPDGITIKVRNLAVSRDAQLYDAAEREMVQRLQERLNDLGCDVGSADGIAGVRTKSAALSCRYFGRGVLPEQLNVATLPTFAALYAREDVEHLPTDPSAVVVRLEHVSTDVVGDQFDNRLVLRGRIEGYDAEPFDIALDVIGRFTPAGRTGVLRIVFQHDLGSTVPEVAGACRGFEVTKDTEGRSHGVVSFISLGQHFSLPDANCIAAELPAEVRRDLEFVMGNFAAIAKAAAASGSLEDQGTSAFVASVASGETTLGL